MVIITLYTTLLYNSNRVLQVKRGSGLGMRLGLACKYATCRLLGHYCNNIKTSQYRGFSTPMVFITTMGCPHTHCTNDIIRFPCSHAHVMLIVIFSSLHGYKYNYTKFMFPPIGFLQISYILARKS